jgi:hypothetical protein
MGRGDEEGGELEFQLLVKMVWLGYKSAGVHLRVLPHYEVRPGPRTFLYSRNLLMAHRLFVPAIIP